MIRKISISLMLIFSVFALISCKDNDGFGAGEIDYDQLNQLSYYEYFNDNNPIIRIKVKDFGEMEAELFPSVANNTVNNFISYILENDFDGSTFHRVIEDFMIQGGIVENTKNPIKGEFSSNGFNNPLKHDIGVLSMARTMFPNSATSQFFVMHKKSPHLDGEYASFGGLISGFDVLNSIATVNTNRSDAPLETIIIESIEIDLRGYKPAEVIYA